MAVIKIVTAFRSNEGRGFTEVHYRDTGSETPNLETQLNSWITNVLTKRQVLLGSDVVIHGVRISYPRAGVIASQSRKVFLTGQSGTQGASQSASLAIPFFDTTRTRHKTMHMRGFWDAVENNEAYHPEGGGDLGWQTKLNEWKTSLTSVPYGWLSKDADLSTKGKVSGYEFNPGGTVTFTVLKDFGANLVAGEQHQVRFSRINGSKSVLNRSLLCVVSDATHLTTTLPIAAGDFQTAGRFNLRRPTFCAYAGCEVPSLGMRRMGSPLFRSPGRAKAKARV